MERNLIVCMILPFKSMHPHAEMDSLQICNTSLLRIFYGHKNSVEVPLDVPPVKEPYFGVYHFSQ